MQFVVDLMDGLGAGARPQMGFSITVGPLNASGGI